MEKNVRREGCYEPSKQKDEGQPRTEIPFRMETRRREKFTVIVTQKAEIHTHAYQVVGGVEFCGQEQGQRSCCKVAPWDNWIKRPPA